MTTRRRWLLGLGLPVLVIGGAFGAGRYWVGQNLVPLAEARASAAIGRPVSIGAIHIDRGRIATNRREYRGGQPAQLARRQRQARDHSPPCDPLRSLALHHAPRGRHIINGQVAVHPISFGVGEGRIRLNARLDPAGNAVRAKAEINFENLDLARLMAATHAFNGAGALSGSARLEGTGNSLAAIAANGDGEILVGMVGGDLSAVLVDLSGLEVGNAVLSALGLPKRTPIECLVADFSLERGILRSRALILDTSEAIVGGAGTLICTTTRSRCKSAPHRSISASARFPGRLIFPGL